MALVIHDLNPKTSLKIIHVYAPTTTHEGDEIEVFYETVTEELEEYKTSHTLIIIGVF